MADGGTHPQVGRDRWVAAQQIDQPPFDIELAAVDFIVTGNHRVAPFPIAGHQPARHRGRGGLDAHAQDRHVFLHVVERLVDPVSVLTDRTVAA